MFIKYGGGFVFDDGGGMLKPAREFINGCGLLVLLFELLLFVVLSVLASLSLFYKKIKFREFKERHGSSSFLFLM